MLMSYLDSHAVRCGVILGLLASVLFTFVPDNDILLLAAMAFLTITGFVAGPRLPLYVKVLFTVLIFYFAGLMCLIGRTMAPGLSLYTVSMALVYFGFMALWPSLSLLRIWRGRARAVLVSCVLPAGLFLAHLVAATEEHIFMNIHREAGADVTPRWTVSMHWLAYDAETGVLRGSD